MSEENNEEPIYWLIEYFFPPKPNSMFSKKEKVVIKAKDNYEAVKKFHKNPKRLSKCTIVNVCKIPVEE